jgi:hypothetical protein
MRTSGPAMRNRAVRGSSPLGGSRTGGTRAALIQHQLNRTKPAHGGGRLRPVRQKRAPIHYANWVKGYFP